ncbi:CsgG/HfaB family protein [Dechloromonas sp. H13]|uniref:CsgG/HfaB family protein n=1 Tax=Dechloromonas sp. H13 TaxID=2570193 RepID=UPI001291AF76|nr:CsgG/HfaB family protein [Dechloromonas sp. H13]
MKAPQLSKCRVLLGGMLCATLAACSNMQMGSPEAKTTATGSAAGSNVQGANSQLEKCAATMGTVAIVEDTHASWYGILTGQWRLGSTVPVLKLLVQQSNCFVVVERGRAMGNIMGERALEQSGEMRKGSNFGKGQMVAADYSMSPSITFSNQNAGGAGAAIGGRLGSVGALLGGSMNVKEASTLLTLIDNRSSVQLAAAEGSARNMDFGAIGGLLGSAAGGIGGGYSNTAEGKVIVAAFTDSYNNLVRAVRNYKAQEVQGGLGTGGQLGVQGGSTPAGKAIKSK